MKAIQILCLFFILLSGCAGNSYTSVSLISESWLEIKFNINSGNTDDVNVQIDNFIDMLADFFASPFGNIYQIHRPQEMIKIKDVIPALNLIKNKINHGDNDGIYPLITEIDASIDLLWRIDTELSDRSQLHYFQMFFFFSMVILIIILALSVINSRLKKATFREKESLAFSRETVLIQEKERSRIAAELHDTVAQDLWRLSFQTESINKAADAQEINRLCAEVIKGQKEVMSRVRVICDTLVPPDFARRGLCDALQSLCLDFSRRTNIECQAVIAQGVRESINSDTLDTGKQLQVFRIVQECLANTEKHAKAGEVSVLVFKQDDNLVIKVSDDGKGFSAPNRDSCFQLRAQGHFGIWNMYERAAAINGNLFIESRPEEGTITTLNLQLKNGGG